MLPEIKAIEPQLKQILYGCVEHVQATKAALYLSSTHDLNEKTYEIVTSYQFNDPTRKTLRGTDDMIDRIGVKRTAFFVNGLGSDQRFSELLFRQSTDRLLVSPLFSRGRLVGFIDMRDKAGKKPFDTPDLEAAKKISEDFVALLGAKNLFGIAPIPVVDAEPQPVRPAAPAPQLMQPAPPVMEVRRGEVLSPQAARAVELARETLAKRQLTHGSGRRHVSDGDAEVLRLLLPAAVAIPGAVMACASAAGHMNNPIAAASLAGVADDAWDAVTHHIGEWLKRANQPHMTARTALLFPFGAQPVPVTAHAITALVTVTVNAHSIEGMLLTVAFERTHEQNAQRAMQVFLKQVEPLVDACLASTAGRSDRTAIAERLLEPDFHKFPDLVEHSRAVATLSQRFASTLEISATQVESIRIAALVHDVGMRLLDYDRLYHRPSLSAEELKALHDHPIVGAALVEPLLGADIAQAVLRHHERVDGKGYPSRLTGNAIPLASRIIQLCDAWVAMTAPRGYQPAIGREPAILRIREASGTQFDEMLVQRFLKVLPEIG